MMAKAKGSCRGSHKRYYFDKVSGSCQIFFYGGESVPFFFATFGKSLGFCQKTLVNTSSQCGNFRICLPLTYYSAILDSFEIDFGKFDFT